MTRLDFIETIKEFIPNLSIDELTNVVEFYGLRVIFKGFTVKINGVIPYDFAMNIYENQMKALMQGSKEDVTKKSFLNYIV